MGSSPSSCTRPAPSPRSHMCQCWLQSCLAWSTLSPSPCMHQWMLQPGPNQPSPSLNHGVRWVPVSCVFVVQPSLAHHCLHHSMQLLGAAVPQRQACNSTESTPRSNTFMFSSPMWLTPCSDIHGWVLQPSPAMHVPKSSFCKHQRVAGNAVQSSSPMWVSVLA